MSVDLPPTPGSEKRKRGKRRSELRVVLDTNALFVTPTSLGSASDLVRPEIARVIMDAKYPDLDILWYLPEIVRHERQYQMQTEAMRLRPAINRIERLLGHNLALTDRHLLDHVETKIDEKKRELGLEEIALDHNAVDWPKLIRTAVYRKPPFEAGEKEKGFRDAIVAESFVQLVVASPRTPSLCRVVLVTSDELLSLAVKERIRDSPNASVLTSIEELKGLINTIVSNVGEEFIAQIKPKAEKLFFASADDKETIFYKENIRERLIEKFKSELEVKPQGTAFRTNGTWHIDWPNFSRKEGRRVFWTSRIEIELTAGTVTTEAESKGEMASLSTLGSLSNLITASGSAYVVEPKQSEFYKYNSLSFPSYISLGPSVESYYKPAPNYVAEKRVTTHGGRDIFRVLWSTEVTMSKDLRKPVVEDIEHIELTCQPIS